MLKITKWDGLNTGNVEEDFSCFLDEFLFLFNGAFPLQKKILCKNKKHKVKWITQGIRKSAETLRRLSREFIVNKKDDFIEFYVKYRKMYKRVVRKAKRIYTDERILTAKNSKKCGESLMRKMAGMR